MNRRKLLLGGGVAFSTILAGCSSEASNENRDEVYAEKTADAVDEESATSVDNWEINDGTFHLHFTPAGSNDRALQIVAGAYAGNVDNGLDLPLTGYGYEGEETVLYFQIEVDWAQQFMDDELSESEYLGRIQETMG
ncbi:hypothetical protein [Natrinema sp. DC36]|uniref:hypothetical protein n=1 Tax=Natrinema sp. DC36 TaxID=2878680 RepID=UPI001CEFD535|nr:hypothetical protein [Natrinema sp. DC36]